MSAVANAVPSASRPDPERSIDELDAAICRLASRINAVNYRLLVLVREFDDRMGWAKWSFPSCAEWLSWRCGISLSAAREKVRTAQALRELPAISLAFREGRLSYTKVRALTRVAALHDEESLLRYALDATAPQVEERCRQIRNVHPDSVHDARRAWEARSLSAWRNAARGTLCLRVELPLEVGELVMQAIERALEQEEVADGVAERSPSRASRANRPMRWWRSRRRISTAARRSRARTQLDGRSLSGRRACRRSSPPWRGWASRRAARNREAPGVRFEPRRRDGGRTRHAAQRGPQAAHGVDAAPARALGARSALHVPGLPPHAVRRCASRAITGSKVGRRASITSCCCARTIIGCCTRAAIGFGATIRASTTSCVRMGEPSRAAGITPTTARTIDDEQRSRIPPRRGGARETRSRESLHGGARDARCLSLAAVALHGSIC